jgi:hypothetical protein
LIEALEAGEFYASTGVRLKHVRRGAKRYKVEVDSEPGVNYTIQFIGTRLDFDRKVEGVGEGVETERGSHRYSAEVGAVLAEVQGRSANYEFAGDELYVRARVMSSKTKLNPYRAGEVEMAWTQPHVVASGAMGGPPPYVDGYEVGGDAGGPPPYVDGYEVGGDAGGPPPYVGGYEVGGDEVGGDEVGGDEGRR